MKAVGLRCLSVVGTDSRQNTGSMRGHSSRVLSEMLLAYPGVPAFQLLLVSAESAKPGLWASYLE